MDPPLCARAEKAVAYLRGCFADGGHRSGGACNVHSVREDDVAFFAQFYQDLSWDQRHVAMISRLVAGRPVGERVRWKYVWPGAGEICSASFRGLHGLSMNALTTLRACIGEKVTLPEHGRVGLKTGPATEKKESIENWIIDYAKTHGLADPGIRPKTPRQYLLPASATVKGMYDAYAASCDSTAVSYSYFARVFSGLEAVSIMTTRSDLCTTCVMLHNELRFAAANEEYDEGVDVGEDVAHPSARVRLERHLAEAHRRRMEYMAHRAEAAKVVEEVQAARKAGLTARGVGKLAMVSFDFAQHISVPFDAEQEGEVYFKTMRKVHVFGITNEGSGEQHTYLVDEADATDKGPNAVVSMLHDYLTNFVPRCSRLVVYADNAVAQNKNNSVLAYFMWLIARSAYDEIEFKFMVPGHTKFSPDGFFGHFKRKYVRSQVDTIYDAANLVEKSSERHHARLHRAEGVWPAPFEPTYPFYAWDEQLRPLMSNLAGISDVETIILRRNDPLGQVHVRYSTSVEFEVKSLASPGSMDRVVTNMPSQVPGKGLPKVRQSYLYNQVRKHVRDKRKADLVCPRPVDLESDSAPPGGAPPLPSSADDIRGMTAVQLRATLREAKRAGKRIPRERDDPYLDHATKRYLVRWLAQLSGVDMSGVDSSGTAAAPGAKRPRND